jgi:mRNA-degrading endonuclease RelE of RelBE toxin-antitoxin system
LQSLAYSTLPLSLVQFVQNIQYFFLNDLHCPNQKSPEIGFPLGNKNNMNLSGFRKVYVSKKRVRIVYEVQNDVLSIYTIAIGKRDDMEVYKKANERL